MGKKNIVKSLATALTVFLLALPSSAEVLLEDDFDGGYNPSGSGNWGSNPNVTAQNNRLEFYYAAGSEGWSEQRLQFPDQSEIWVQYDLFIPQNYAHRTSGGGCCGSGTNNKFFAFYNQPYGTSLQQNFTLSDDDTDGESNLDIRLNSAWNGAWEPGGGWPVLIDESDLGSWMTIKMQMVMATSANNDGEQRLWKDGVLVFEADDLPVYVSDRPLYNEAYILGYANTGFAQDTTFYVDNFVLGTQESDLTGVTVPVYPKAPGSPSCSVDGANTFGNTDNDATISFSCTYTCPTQWDDDSALTCPDDIDHYRVKLSGPDGSGANYIDSASPLSGMARPNQHGEWTVYFRACSTSDASSCTKSPSTVTVDVTYLESVSGMTVN